MRSVLSMNALIDRDILCRVEKIIWWRDKDKTFVIKGSNIMYQPSFSDKLSTAMLNYVCKFGRKVVDWKRADHFR